MTNTTNEPAPFVLPGWEVDVPAKPKKGRVGLAATLALGVAGIAMTVAAVGSPAPTSMPPADNDGPVALVPYEAAESDDEEVAADEAAEQAAAQDAAAQAAAEETAAQAAAEQAAAEQQAAEQAAAEDAAEQAATDQAAAAQAASEQAASEQAASEQAASEQRAAAPAVESIAPTTLYTTATLNIREGAGVDTTKVGQLRPGTQVVVDAKANGFFRLADGRGWLGGAYLSSSAPVVAPTKPSPAPDVVWSTFVGNAGGQAEVDACTGGLTDVTEWSNHDFNGGRYYVLHRSCGGAPALSLSTGNVVTIDGARYQVVGATAIPYPGWTGPGLVDNASWGVYYDRIETLGGDVYIQTCYKNHADGMRVVALKKL